MYRGDTSGRRQADRRGGSAMLEFADPRPAARGPDARLRAAQAAQGHARGASGAFSYGSLYPTLRRHAGRAAGSPRTSRDAEVEADAPAADRQARQGRLQAHRRGQGAVRRAARPRRARPRGRTSSFGVHFAFFAQTDAEVRLRILEGRRRRLEERREGCPQPWPAPASGSTATPWSSRSTGSSRPTARSAGSTSSSQTERQPTSVSIAEPPTDQPRYPPAVTKQKEDARTWVPSA